MPPPLIYDRVWETSTSTGTGDMTLAGAVVGHSTFAARVGASRSCYYCIGHRTANEWEVGIGTVGSGLLQRNTVISSSTGSAVSFSAGTKDVFVTRPAGFVEDHTDGRLTISTGVSVTTTDVTGGTLYYTPHVGNRLNLFGGSIWHPYTFTESSLALSQSIAAAVTGNTTNVSPTVTSVSSTAALYAGQPITGTGIPSGTVIQSVDSGTQITLSKNATATNSTVSLSCYPANYDVWGYDNGSALALDLTAWTNNTTRATALASQDGVLYKNGDTGRRYLGSFRVSSLNTLESSMGVVGTGNGGKRYLWNYRNRVPLQLLATDTTSSWNYTTNAWRQVRAQVGNRVELFLGLSEDPVQAVVQAAASNATGSGQQVAAGLGVDSTTVNSAQLYGAWAPPSGTVINAQFMDFLAAGYHALNWLEISVATGTTVWQGTGAAAVSVGVLARMMG